MYWQRSATASVTDGYWHKYTHLYTKSAVQLFSFYRDFVLEYLHEIIIRNDDTRTKKQSLAKRFVAQRDFCQMNMVLKNELAPTGWCHNAACGSMISRSDLSIRLIASEGYLNSVVNYSLRKGRTVSSRLPYPRYIYTYIYLYLYQYISLEDSKTAA